MTEYELLTEFRNIESQLRLAGYSVNPVKTGFFIMHNGTIVGECQTVEGVKGFLQGVEWEQALVAGALA